MVPCALEAAAWPADSAVSHVPERERGTDEDTPA